MTRPALPINPTPKDWAAHYNAERVRLERCPVSCSDGWIYARPSTPPSLFPHGIRCHPQDERCDRRGRCVFGCEAGP